MKPRQMIKRASERVLLDSKDPAFLTIDQFVDLRSKQTLRQKRINRQKRMKLKVRRAMRKAA